jgi:hypothetical protein
MTVGWTDVSNPKAQLGYYYANQDPESRLSVLYLELRPFTKSASMKDHWPLRSELPAEEPLGVTMGWVNFPYAGKGTFQAGPVALQVHTGDWHLPAQSIADGTISASKSRVPAVVCVKKMLGSPSVCRTPRMRSFIALLNCRSSQPTHRSTG